MNTTTILAAFIGFLLGAIFAFWLDMYRLSRKQRIQAEKELAEIDRAEIDRLSRYAK
jgi:ABC-type amino acid transport system permease subunit